MKLLVIFLLAICNVAATPSDLDPFGSGQILNFQINISAEGITRLKARPRQSVSATIDCNDLKAADATLHLKGHGSFQDITAKPSFSIRLGSQRLGGRKKVLLNNSSQDGSYLRWKLASELFSKAGIPTARLTFARVKLNNRDLGLYLLLEPTDKLFLNHHFGSSKGNLYEGSNNDIGDKLEVDQGDRTKPQIDLSALAHACAEPDLTARWGKLNQVLDVNRFLSFMALEVLVAHHDGYSLDRNNFRIYHDPTSHRLVFIPHGMDLIFDHSELPLEPHFSGVVARALFETPEGISAYRTRIRALGRRFFTGHLLTDRLGEISKIIEPAADTETISAGQELRKQIETRTRFVMKELQSR